MLKKIITISTFCLTLPLVSHAELAEDIHDLQLDWAKANYELGDDAQKNELKSLIKRAETVTESHSDAAEGWIWLGIIQLTYAGKAGPFDALGYAKAARQSLEKAIELNADALQGSAYTSLGTLYFKVPGWPLGFGNDDKARELLEKAVAINPKGIDSNYFYADFLYDQGEYDMARQHLLTAQRAPARTERPLADRGRHQEILKLLENVNEKLEYNDNNKTDDGFD